MSIRCHQILGRMIDSQQAVVVIVDDPEHPANSLLVEPAYCTDHVMLALTIHEFTSVVTFRTPEPNGIHALDHKKCAAVNHSSHFDLGRNRAGTLVPSEHSGWVSQTDH